MSNSRYNRPGSVSVGVVFGDENPAPKLAQQFADDVSTYEDEILAKNARRRTKRRFGFRQIVIVLAALTIVAIPVYEYWKSRTLGFAQLEFDEVPNTAVRGRLLQRFDGIMNNAARLENPELSWYERYFCTGYRRSFICGTKPIHPLINYIEDVHQIKYEDWLLRTGQPLPDSKLPGTRTGTVMIKPSLAR